MSFSKVLDPTKVFEPPGFEGVDPKELKGSRVWNFIYHAMDNLPEGKNKWILSNFICGGYWEFDQIHCVGDKLYWMSTQSGLDEKGKPIVYDTKVIDPHNDKIPLRRDYELCFDSEGVTIDDFYYLASQIVGFHDSFFNWDRYCLMKKGDDDLHKNNMKKILIENNIIEKISQLPKAKKEDVNFFHNGKEEFYEKDNTLNRNNITRSIIMLFLEAIMNKDDEILNILTQV